MQDLYYQNAVMSNGHFAFSAFSGSGTVLGMVQSFYVTGLGMKDEMSSSELNKCCPSTLRGCQGSKIRDNGLWAVPLEPMGAGLGICSLASDSGFPNN